MSGSASLLIFAIRLPTWNRVCPTAHGRGPDVLAGGRRDNDEDVKKYFFSLSARERRPIFDEYEEKYGRSAREYAEKALPEWRARSKGMAGQTAIRLFNLLPPRMPGPQNTG